MLFRSEIDGTDWALEVGTESIETSLGYPSLVYDYHGVWGQKHRSELASVRFYEKYAGTQPTKALLFTPPVDEWSRVRTLMGLIEAAIARIAVLDERIAGKAMAEDRLEDLTRAGIHLPEGISYNAPTRDDFERLLDWSYERSIRIVTIHQGMIDKAFNNREDAIDAWVTRMRDQANVPILVVHSDRGEALLPRLPANVRFVPYSSIEPWFSGNGVNKYFLTQTLLSSRRGVEHAKTACAR